MTTIRTTPTVTAYSVQYQRDLLAAKAEILLAHRFGELPLPRLVWQARTAYQRAWARELERTPC